MKTETPELMPARREELSTPAEEPSATNMLAMIERAAGNPAIDVDKMERLLALHERIVARQAETAFNIALAEAQNEMPRIQRDAKNPSTNSLYARLESLNKEAVPIYTKHGFSLSFGTAESKLTDSVMVTCVVSHRDGFSRNYQCDIPLDIAGAKGNLNKTRTHGFGSTLSYGRRYLTLLIFNISLVNEDDDGNQGNRPKPPGPSTLAAEDSVKKYAQQLWTLLKPVRGSDPSWVIANQWLWKFEVLDGAVPEEAPNLSVARFKEVIAEATEKLK